LEHTHSQAGNSETPYNVKGCSRFLQATEEEEAQGSDTHAANGENSGADAV
jgi:hypothetical protein